MAELIAKWSYLDTDGLRKQASGVVIDESSSSVRVVIQRDRGDSIIEVPRGHATITDLFADAISSDSIRARFVMGTPNASQMAKINQLLPAGAEPFSADQVVTIPFVASDNLVNRSLDRWDIDSLRRMAQLFPGLPVTRDHDWESADKEWGRVYAAHLVKVEDVPAQVLDRAGNKQSNQAVIAEEGCWQVICEVFATVDKKTVQDLNSGHSGNVSTGGFRFRDYHCPICKTSFSDPKCPHIPNHRWLSAQERKELQVADFSVRVGLFDLGELSIVLIPNLPNAGILR
jgi:hypothetical protein